MQEHEPAVGQAGLALVAADGEVLLNKILRRPPSMPVTRYSDMPYLLPLAERPRAGASTRCVDPVR